MALSSVKYTEPAAGTLLATDQRGGSHYQATAPSQLLLSSGLALQSGLFDLNPAVAGNNGIVAATGGQTILVYGWVLCSWDEADLQWASGATAKFPLLPFGAGEKEVEVLRADPYFACGVGEALNLNSNTTGRKTGIVYYTKG